jgi:hypothetical protein
LHRFLDGSLSRRFQPTSGHVTICQNTGGKDKQTNKYNRKLSLLLATREGSVITVLI